MVDAFRFATQAVVLALGLSTAGLAQAQIAANPLAPGVAPVEPKMLPPREGAAAKPIGPATAETTGPSGALAHTPGYDYILGPGDKLRITVYEEEDLSGEFSVAGNGRISFPLIGEVPASGRTVQQVQDAIAAKLRDGYVKDPRVSAEVLTFRPFFILGEVSRPGEYPYINDMTVMNAIATAGGFTYRANHRTVFIKGVHEPHEHKIRLTDSLTLAPGDTVRVGARLF